MTAPLESATKYPHAVEVTRENFTEVVVEGSRSQPVLVDFWADWCAPCKVLMPILEQLAQEYAGTFVLAKVNADEQPEVAAQFGVRSLPTVVLIKDSQVVDHFMGAQPESEVRALLDRHIPKSANGCLAQARQAVAAGDVPAALARMAEAHQLAPDRSDVALEYAVLLAGSGQVEEALALVEALPEALQTDPKARGILAIRTYAERAAGLEDAGALEARIQNNPKDLEARYQRAVRAIAAQEYEKAMAQLLAIVEADRAFQDEVGRTTLVELFQMLGGANPLVREYRRKLARALN